MHQNHTYKLTPSSHMTRLNCIHDAFSFFFFVCYFSALHWYVGDVTKLRNYGVCMWAINTTKTFDSFCTETIRIDFSINTCSRCLLCLRCERLYALAERLLVCDLYAIMCGLNRTQMRWTLNEPISIYADEIYSIIVFVGMPIGSGSLTIRMELPNSRCF